MSQGWWDSAGKHCGTAIANDTWFVLREQNPEKELREATTATTPSCSFFSIFAANAQVNQDHLTVVGTASDG